MTGEQLKLWRRGNRLTQIKMARAFKLDDRTIGRYEDGNPPPVFALATIGYDVMKLKQEWPNLSPEAQRARINALMYGLDDFEL